MRFLQPSERSLAAELWRGLEDALDSKTIACGWDWTETWLRHYGDLVPHRFAVAEGDGEAHGIALVTEGVQRRRGPFKVRTLHLGTAGEPVGDSVYVEYNRMLVHEAHRDAFAIALLAAIRRTEGWDELTLDGFVPGEAAAFMTAEPRLTARIDPCPVMDLRPARSHGDAMADLRSSVRSRIRRSLRLLGPLQTEWATTNDHALDVLDELIALHQARWTAEGLPGLFSSARLTAFHRELVPRLLADERAVLYRVRNNAGTVGCLYGYVEDNRVLCYQSGFAGFTEDNRIKPGLVTHALCMQEALERGIDEYDFLAGDQRYKRELANMERQLVWARAVRRRPKPMAIEGLRRLRRAYGRRAEAPTGGADEAAEGTGG